MVSWGESWGDTAVSTACLSCTIASPVTRSACGFGAAGSIIFSFDVNRKLLPLEIRNANTEILALRSLTGLSLIPAESGGPSESAGLDVRVA